MDFSSNACVYLRNELARAQASVFPTTFSDGEKFSSAAAGLICRSKRPPRARRGRRHRRLNFDTAARGRTGKLLGRPYRLLVNSHSMSAVAALSPAQQFPISLMSADATAQRAWANSSSIARVAVDYFALDAANRDPESPRRAEVQSRAHPLGVAA
jgi:hypothetical protein